jgi:hypothetical protein
VPRDRADYSKAIASSWQRQTLLNIVKLRYLDVPVFVDVGQIVSGYSLETSVSANGGYSDGDLVVLGAGARFTDRPTITYVPLTGDDYLRGLLTPVRPESVFFLIQAGYPADGVLLSMVSSINGLKNEEASLEGVAPPSPEFLRVLHLMRQLQLAGGLGLRVETNHQTGSTSILTIRREHPASPEIAEAGRELERLLDLDSDATEFKLAFATVPANSRELAVVTRSLVQLMKVMASQADIPPEDLTEGRATPGWESVPDLPDELRFIRIHSDKSKPADAAVAVEYRDRWFWIDDRDLKSKRSFNVIMVMFTLANTGQREGLPLITIPAQ